MKKILFFVVLIVIVPFIVVNLFVKEEEIKFNYTNNLNVRVKRDAGIVTVPLEDYVVGVLAGEMPIEFEMEALKAQAVAARSYVLKKMEQNKEQDYDVVDTVMPSVVSIFGTYSVTENFWGYAIRQEETGSGSGFIVGENEDELLLVTNNHVVADSTSLSVQFIDESIYDAVVKGTDADADLAVIAIKLSDLSAATKSAIRIATLGDSDNLKVGEPAIAIGNALGYGQSVTTGVISALNRDYSVDEDGNTQALIQTDAAINPGNSGGALLNVSGEVIGINSNKIAGTKVEGMGYAIPISTAKPIIAELMNKQTRTPVEQNKRGYLGISGLNVDSQVQEMYGIPVGVYISRVYEGTAAQKAGLKKGDIIISCDGETVETMEGLSALLDSMEAGTSVQIGVMMSVDGGYQERILEVTLDGNQ